MQVIPQHVEVREPQPEPIVARIERPRDRRVRRPSRPPLRKPRPSTLIPIRRRLTTTNLAACAERWTTIVLRNGLAFAFGLIQARE